MSATTTTTAVEPIIEARKLEKFYPQPDGNRIQVIAPTDIAIYPGQIIALLGPSGCGKSTMLRMLTGLSPASGGEVYWHGQPVKDETPNVSIVFQSFALFPWLTVIENVEAPLEARGLRSSSGTSGRCGLLTRWGWTGSSPHIQRSFRGGMKQRVGVARALVVEPEVLFMDEPFSALDVLTAETLRGELLELWLGKKIPTRAIFIVTHNIEEAVILADRIIVLGRNPAHIHAEFNVDTAASAGSQRSAICGAGGFDLSRADAARTIAEHTASGVPGTEGTDRKTHDHVAAHAARRAGGTAGDSGGPRRARGFACAGGRIEPGSRFAAAERRYRSAARHAEARGRRRDHYAGWDRRSRKATFRSAKQFSGKRCWRTFRCCDRWNNR